MGSGLGTVYCCVLKMGLGIIMSAVALLQAVGILYNIMRCFVPKMVKRTHRNFLGAQRQQIFFAS